jgi:Sigma-54 interaction domain
MAGHQVNPVGKGEKHLRGIGGKAYFDLSKGRVHAGWKSRLVPFWKPLTRKDGHEHATAGGSTPEVLPCAQGLFIEVICAAIQDTPLEAEPVGFGAGVFSDAKRPKPDLFEAPSGGSLFLDEVEALPQELRQLPQRAVQATLVIRQLEAKARAQMGASLSLIASAAAWPAVGLALPGVDRVQCSSTSRVLLETRVYANVPCIAGELDCADLIQFNLTVRNAAHDSDPNSAAV